VARWAKLAEATKITPAALVFCTYLFPSSPSLLLNARLTKQEGEMNAKILSKVPVGLTVTALALCGAVAISGTSSCAGGGGTAGNGGGQGGSNGGAGGSNGGTTGSTECPAAPGADEVNFCLGKAQGKMTGFAYIALGAADTATDPVCAPDSADTTVTREITKDAPCPTSGTTVWKSADSLCISGTIPVVTGGDYTGNWGLQIGVNTVDPPATSAGNGTLGSTYSTIAVTTTGTVTPKNNAIRVVIHTVDMAAEANPYCATMASSGDKITLTAFNTECWGPTSAALTLTADKIPDIDKIGVQISSDVTNEYTVQDFCVTGITFGN
jgi:hypothetical protein